MSRTRCNHPKRVVREIERLVRSLRQDFDFDHSRPTQLVSRGDFERLLEFAEQCLKNNDN